ncbi:hypothetical protein BHE74_00008885 [Ensete ventricosum]|nr:hypothetical protein GW17_00021289 [Ensete ventricosum]RWW82642.1 hypothetical protein BHE74_00008885 [Ensete ventricosum]RZR82102.1 hypothetical protein BHM03_00008444 [Ensete ventricosum]
MIGATRELDYFSAYIRLREPGKSEDKAEQWIVGPWAGSVMVPQRRDFHGVIDPLLSWRESVGPKGVKDVENAEAKSKYQDRMKGQRPRNFIRPVSMGFSSR